MKFFLCLSFAGFECRALGQSPDPARLPRLQQPRFSYNLLSFTSPFFRCILRKRAEQTISLGTHSPSLTFSNRCRAQTCLNRLTKTISAWFPVSQTCSAGSSIPPDFVLTAQGADAARLKSQPCLVRTHGTKLD